MSSSLSTNITPDERGKRHVQGADNPVELLAELAAADWHGPRIEVLRDDLYLYGWDVLRGLIRDRRIRTIPAGIPPVELAETSWVELAESTDLRHELVVDTLVRAIPKLIKNLRAGKFDPERSSLTTYFIGQCAIVFRDVATSWQTRWHREQFELAAFDWDEVFGGLPTADDLDHRLDLRAAVATILGGLMPTQRIVLVRCLLEGLSYAETGELLHITARAVDGHLRRARREAHHLVNREYIRYLLDGDPDSYGDDRGAA